MTGELLARLEAGVTFVVGKGGVGKTTVAGGLGLALADAGTPTHLLSTDPAHSLGDLFGCRLTGAPRSSPCSDRLTLEELDAAGVARSRLEALTPGLIELIERGTYLDEADASMLLAGSVPGLDEVGAALRIVELAESRLIVDSAPTGHLLRLLDSPGIIRSWIDVFEAMAAKAGAVASALVRHPVRMTVERDLEALLSDADAFEAVAGNADFIVVTGAGEVVRQETRRLVARLRERHLRVAVTVAIDRPGAEAELLVPHRHGLAGCAALRAWWRGADQPPGERPSHERAVGAAVGGRAATGIPPELDREVLVFGGKGGVGKSTCAAATGVRLAAVGPVLLLSADPAGSLHDILAGEAVTGLEVREIDAVRELERLRSLYRSEVEDAFRAIGLDRAARMDRAVIESLWQLAPPGIDELIGVSRLASEVESGTRVVVDSAPTGHFLRLMGMPELALDWVHRLMRILLKYSAIGELDAPAGHLLRFARQFRGLRDRLLDGDRTAIVVVSLDEPLVRAETERLTDRLRELDLPVQGTIVNRAAGVVSAAGAGAVWRAPEVAEPRGVTGLEEFIAAWERVA